MAEETEDVSKMLALGITAVERGEHEAALQLLRRVYQLIPPETAPQGLSAYGFALAKVERKHKAGAELAQKAIDMQFYEGRHWANLVRIYIAAKNRRKAVEVLETGLKKMRGDKALLRVRDEIKYRKAPYFRFLPRQHPLNKVYSKAASKVKVKPVYFKWAVIILAAAAYASFVATIFFAILK